MTRKAPPQETIADAAKAWLADQETIADVLKAWLADQKAQWRAALKKAHEDAVAVLESQNGKAWARIRELLKQAQKDEVVAASPAALEFVGLLLKLTHNYPYTRLERVFEPIDGQLPKGQLGEKFMRGRKPESGSLLRRPIRAALRTGEAKTAAQVWAVLKANPPKGVSFHDARWGEAKYVETEGRHRTGYRRFANIVSEEKRKLHPK
jgi:hypothetical protein